jgi:hypothetical protein
MLRPTTKACRFRQAFVMAAGCLSLQRGLHRNLNNPYHLDIFTVFAGI